MSSPKIGVIYVGYGTKDLVAKSLDPWVKLRADENYSVNICAVSVKFAGFTGDDDGTTALLNEYRNSNKIDNIITEPNNIPETAARGMALEYLRTKNVDIVCQWDSDEIPTDQDLQNIFKFVESTPDVAWYRISYANMVFDEKTYLAEPFAPPRIFRMKYGAYKLHSFSGDNDIQYGGIITRDIVHQNNFPSLTIPWICANPRHHSWLSNERSKKKIEYQLQGRGWPQCSFAWDNEKNCLIFNPDLPVPKIIRITD